MSKYHARKTKVDGIMFDSKREAARYKELQLLERAGEISGLERQVSFELLPPFTHKGRKVRGIQYRADFTYTTKEGEYIVEDVKGVRTQAYKLKKKLFEFRYPDLDIKEV